MIIFKKVRWKNFLSTGDRFTEINLTKTRSTLVIGHNGAGKSTILDAVSVALFGKAHRNISKPQLVNSINGKHCIVEVEFNIGRAEYKIIRGIKPSKFEIWKNDVMINQSSHAKDYQKILEQNILKLNHKSFHQVVVLGSSSFIPFMQLPSNHRRDVIEDLLDINVFSKMNMLLKEKQSLLREEMKDIGYKLDMTKSKLESQKKYIRDITILTEENRKDYESRINESQKSINELQAANNDLSIGLDENIGKAEKELSTLHNQRQVLLLDSQDRKTNLSNVNKRVDFFEQNESCPVCDQALSDDHKSNIIDSLHEEISTHKGVLKQIGSEGTQVETQINETNKILESLRSKVSELSDNNIKINSYQKQIEEYRRYLEKNVNTDLEKAHTDLQIIDQERISNLENKLKLSDVYSYNQVMGEMLRDTGIKTKIIKQYVPVINKLVNQYLQVLDFFVHFDLDESFKETIRSRHRDDFSYDSFSEGEKQRIDLALLFTWRQIAKMKNSVATNLLILDETFDSSLDYDGVENLLKILNTLSNDTNIFVISHKGDILDNKFDSKIEFFKDKNFSQMKAA